MPVLKISVGDRSAMMVGYLLDQNERSDRVQAIGGNVVGQSPEGVEREFQETREFYGNHGGRQYYHVALSFERSDLGDMTTAGRQAGLRAYPGLRGGVGQRSRHRQQARLPSCGPR